MLDIKYIRENVKKIKKNAKNRLADVDIDALIVLDTDKKQIESNLEQLRAERNKASKTKPTPEVVEQMKTIGLKISELEQSLDQILPKFREMLMKVPNLTHPKVKVSADEDDNPVLGQFLEPTKFDFTPLDHVELALRLDLIDFDRASKVTGAKFYYLKNELALLEQALIQYAFATVIKYGFTPFITPDLAKQEVLEGLGYSPRGESTQIYSVADTDLCLIGTSEITMGGLHMDEVLDEANLPIKYAALSHCYRTEAGSYSKFAKGIFRVHQFTKVEMFVYATPSQSEKIHKELLSIEKKIFSSLGIPYRVIDHCTADLGNPSYRTYDLEAWLPGKPKKDGSTGDWAEITSTSNCTDFQARGLNIKYRTEKGEKQFVHMLNGTAISMARALIAIMENYQQADGTITIPNVLQKYMPGKITRISRS
ncbi:MAG: serine--tRNA ligase [Candidatus Falkowbacteria bacterium]